MSHARAATLRRPHGDDRDTAIAVLEALYRPEPIAERWAEGILAEVGRVVDASLGAGLNVAAHGDDLADPRFVMRAGAIPHWPEISDVTYLERMFRGQPEAFRLVFYPGPAADTQSDLEARSRGATLATWRAVRATFPVADALCIYAYPEGGVVLIVWVVSDRTLTLSRRDRHVLFRVSAHLDTAFRLRLKPEVAVAAVVDPRGAYLDIADPGVERGRERLSAQVLAVERARLARHRRSLDALSDWQALIGGRYTVVPREDHDAKRFYLLVHNGGDPRAHPRFTARESEVVRLSARGFSGKVVAYALGMSPSSVSSALASAAAKVGLRTHFDLVAVARACVAAGPSRPPAERLTTAEQAVLDLLRRGLSNAEIARLRGRSVNTVANQVASVLRKSGLPSRRSLGPTDP